MSQDRREAAFSKIAIYGDCRAARRIIFGHQRCTFPSLSSRQDFAETQRHCNFPTLLDALWIMDPFDGEAAGCVLRSRLRWFHRPAVIMISAGCSACSSAPAQNVFGSFVPSWLSCAVAGLAAAVLCRFIFKFAGLGDQLLAAPLTYVGIAIAIALAAWLFWFGH